MQVILDSLFARPGSAPICGAGRKESSGTGLRAYLTRNTKVCNTKVANFSAIVNPNQAHNCTLNISHTRIASTKC